MCFRLERELLLCKHFREPNLDRYSTYCDVDGKDISDVVLTCQGFEPKL